MSALLSGLLAKFAPYIIAGLAALAAIAGAWIKGRSSGVAKEKAKQAAARQKDISEAKAIEDAVAGNDAAKNRKELGTWSRG